MFKRKPGIHKETIEALRAYAEGETGARSKTVSAKPTEGVADGNRPNARIALRHAKV